MNGRAAWLLPLYEVGEPRNWKKNCILLGMVVQRLSNAKYSVWNGKWLSSQIPRVCRSNICEEVLLCQVRGRHQSCSSDEDAMELL